MPRQIRHIIFSGIMALTLVSASFSQTPVINNELVLTNTEKAWLAKHPVVRVRISPTYAPFEFFADGKYQGIACEYLTKVGKKLGISFQPVTGVSWEEALARVKNHDGVDMILLLSKSAERNEFLEFSRNYLSFPLVIFTPKGRKFISGIKDLSGTTVAIEKGYIEKEWLARDVPGISFLEVEGSAAAIEATATGKADAYVGNLALGSYYIEKNMFTNLQVAAPTPYKDDAMAMGVRKDWPELARLIDKALVSLSADEESEIRHKWLSIRYEHGFRGADILKWVAIVTGAALILIFQLRNMVKRRTAELQSEVELRREKERELYESEERSRTIFNSVNDAIFVRPVTTEGETNYFLTVNDIACTRLGYTRDELLRMTIDDIDVLANSPRVQSAQKQLIMSGSAYFETLHRTKDGRTFPVEINSHRTELNGRKIILSVARDISERKQSEHALLASENKFRDIFENAPIGIFQSSIAGRFISVNQTMAVLYNYPSPEQMLTDITDIASELFVNSAQRKDIVQKVMNSEKYIREEVYYRRRDGSTFCANLYLRKVLNEQSPLPFMEGFVEDITERKLAEERLREYQDNLERLVADRTAALESANRELQREIEVRITAEKLLVYREAQYRDLVESANSVILRWQPNGRITFFNKFAQDFFGYREEEILGRNIIGTVVPETDSTGHDLSALAADIVARPEAYVRNENENVRKDGERVWIAWTNKPILAGDGTIIEILSIGVDITQLVLTERELRTTLQDLAVAKDRAEAADQLKSAFLATMSHELRTPLNSIIGFTGILLQGLVGGLNDEQKKQLNMVRTSANHLLSLINDVLDISKIEAGQLQVSSEPLDLQALINKVIQTVQPLAEKKGLELTIDICPDNYAMSSDPRRLEQILLNLLSNAVKFTEHGQVSLTCSRTGEDVVISVKDTGIGIKDVDIPMIFKPFQQIDTGLSRKYEGTGLGLSICKKLVELLGGKIWVESAWEAGSTFGFSLPLERKSQ